eukprot:12456103-Alexandrium_andersonii.AAC.1
MEEKDDPAAPGAVKQAVAKLEGGGEKRPAAEGSAQTRAASGPPAKAPKPARWTDKLTTVTVPADGSWLWHSLAGALNHRKSDHGGPERVRSVVVGHMREHP